MKLMADDAASPASFQPWKAATRAGARRPSGRRSQRRGCIRSTVQDGPVIPDVLTAASNAVPGPSGVSALRAGEEVDLVLACSRKERLMARSGSPYLALELRDRSGAITARAFRDADVLAGRFERGDLVRVRGRVERFRDALQLDVVAVDRAQADPAQFLPVAYRD